MLICKLKGGLGNQMFQYAAGRFLAYPDAFLLDDSFLNDKSVSKPGFTKRKYELEIFDKIKAKKANKNYIKLIQMAKPDRRIWPNYKLVNDKNFLERQNGSKEKLFLDGYFQVVDHLNKIRPLLLDEFTFPPIHKNQNIVAQEILNANYATSLHVRRGDYLNKVNIAHHGIMPISYYEQAVSHIKSKFSNPTVFILSDDPHWCKKELSFLDVSKVFLPSEFDPWIYMYLSSICKHNIIANSTFSWWGAWLNTNPLKKVIAPEKWFQNKDLNQQFHRLFPKEWIRL